ncbi:MAG: insulinase family protein [Rhizobiales bacterium]|nr:insulinase family protein [Hyphomicrobiales bacterium]
MVVTNRLHRVIAAFALGCLPAIAAIAVAQAVASPVSQFTLTNGLEVVVIPDHRAPVVTHMMWYKVGAADEPAGKSGIAHFLEHLMFKGTKKNPAGRFSKFVGTIGGHENAFTSSDYTGYFQRVAKENLKALMEFEADRMTGLVLTDDVVKPELNVILEEHNQRVANNPGARLGEQVQAALYLNHPYGKPVIGWRHEIEQLTRDDALAFYKRFYSPNNAILVVAGDVTAEEVKKFATDIYGKVERRAEIGPRRRPQEPQPNAMRQVTLADPQVRQPSLNRSYLVPSIATAKKDESVALDVLAQILGAASTGRMYRTLVAEKSVAVNAGAWYQGSALDMTRFGVYATPRPDVSLTALDSAIDGVIDDVVAKGVTADELERAKTRLISDFVFAQDSQTTLARWYGVALTTGSSVDRVLTWSDRIRAVTLEEVHAAARQWLDKRRSVTGYLVKDLVREDKRS